MCLSCFNFVITERKRARNVAQLGEELHIPDFTSVLSRFLFEQAQRDTDDAAVWLNTPEANYPQYHGKIKVFNSANALFYAPSDVSGIHGMRREIIRSSPNWRNEGPRKDCVFVNANPETDPMNGLEVARVLAFFSFHFKGNYYPSAVVNWFDRVGDQPDEDTGMWLVRPQITQRHQRTHSIIHIDTVYRAAHLIPVYAKDFVPNQPHPHQSYDNYQLFYVNKYADHHAFEIAS